jgi:hypothetical protein
VGFRSLCKAHCAAKADRKLQYPHKNSKNSKISMLRGFLSESKGLFGALLGACGVDDGLSLCRVRL